MNQKAHIERRFERETGATSRHNVDGPASVRPAPELLTIHPEFTAGDLADLFVDAAELKFPYLEAHRSAAIAAAAGLMKHERTMCLLELLDELTRRICDADAAWVHGDYVTQTPSPICACACTERTDRDSPRSVRR